MLLEFFAKRVACPESWDTGGVVGSRRRDGRTEAAGVPGGTTRRALRCSAAQFQNFNDAEARLAYVAVTRARIRPGPMWVVLDRYASNRFRGD